MPRQSHRVDEAALRTLEERLGYAFQDQKWILRALTHSSARTMKDVDRDNERLEFLGDRVLGIAIAEMLFQAMPDATEGTLARSFNALVCKDSCVVVAENLDLGRYLHLGGGESKGGGRSKRTILGDACEAVLGAVFIDGGFSPARELILREWDELRGTAMLATADAKTALQEWAQSRGLDVPRYADTGRTGPDHRPVFKVEVMIEGKESGAGHGASKRHAQQAAARLVLEREGVWEPEDLHD